MTPITSEDVKSLRAIGQTLYDVASDMVGSNHMRLLDVRDELYDLARRMEGRENAPLPYRPPVDTKMPGKPKRGKR